MVKRHLILLTNPCYGDAGSNPTKCNIIFEALGMLDDISEHGTIPLVTYYIDILIKDGMIPCLIYPYYNMACADSQLAKVCTVDTILQTNVQHKDSKCK